MGYQNAPKLGEQINRSLYNKLGEGLESLCCVGEVSDIGHQIRLGT